MRRGHVDAVTRDGVSGWAADDADPHARLKLCVRVDGQEVANTVADGPRRDLAALGRYGDGAHGFSLRFTKSLTADADHRVSVHFADDALPLPNGDRQVLRDVTGSAQPAPDTGPPEAPSHDEGPNPILVTAPGRSGTTYLMSCLAASPQIVVAELIPYEVRLLSYYAAAYGVLTAPANLERSTHPDRLEGDGYHVGSNPFTAPQYAHAFNGRAGLDELYGIWAPARLGAAMADIVREYYRRLALDRGKGAVPFFAEKNNNLHRPSRMFVRRVFATMREVVIVRDPRDVLCSHLAYFGSSEDKAFAQLSHSCRQLTPLADTAGGALHILRYEDMIRGEAKIFADLSTFLGAEVAPIASRSSEKIFAQHGTSTSPETSIGRWRHDLPDTAKARAAQDWGGFLQRFGYDRR